MTPKQKYEAKKAARRAAGGTVNPSKPTYQEREAEAERTMIHALDLFERLVLVAELWADSQVDLPLPGEPGQ